MRRDAALIKITKSFNRSLGQKGFGSVTKRKEDVLKKIDFLGWLIHPLLLLSAEVEIL